MNVLIIEDEMPARAKLKQMLSRIDTTTSVVAELGSVKESVAWLSSNRPPDIAFVDIQLSDDHSFEIFRRYPVKFPVVFTTAYDKYLLESFEYNSIDYLLKPITEDRLTRSLQKVAKLREHFLQGQFQQFILNHKEAAKSLRIIAKKGTEFITLNCSEIAYFYTEHKVVFVKELTGRKLIVDHTLAELEETLKSENFFRLNRKFLANAKAVEKYKSENGKLLIFLHPQMNEEIYVSKESAPEFRQWIGQKPVRD